MKEKNMSIRIPISVLSNENINHMEKKLMIAKEVSKNPHSFFVPKKTPFFKRDHDDLCVPFHWGKSYFGSKYIPIRPTVPFHFQGQLRSEQEILEMEGMESVHENNTCLLAVYPGGGKTITSLSMVSKLQRKTIIIVNKLVLVEQWKESIEQFLGIQPFVIGGIHCKIQPNSIYIINAINIPKHNFQDMDIGCCIVDECHLILSTVFSQGLFHIHPEYLIGLSATPYRSDGYNLLFDIYFGIHRIERSLHRPHDVLQIVTDEVIEHEMTTHGKIDWNSVITKQCLSDNRQKLITHYCMEYPERNILILCKRIVQMKILYDMLREKGQHVSMFKENDTTFDRDCRILISSYQKVGTGFSFNKLDMLILGTDTEEYFLQYLGRVFRRLDVRPCIIDIVDKHSILQKHFSSRKRIYKKCGGTIKKMNKNYSEVE